MITIEDMAGSGVRISCSKAVIKLGSNVVLGEDDNLDLAVLESLAESISILKKQGVKTTIVSSGAIGLACNRLRRKRPKVIPDKQAMAAIGQISLMHRYQEIFRAKGLTAAQVLLTRADMEDRRRYLNARHALERLHELDAVPIINENDTTSIDELSFGDNDVLSAYVAVKMKADLLIILSTAEGVMTSPPKAGAAPPERLKIIERLDENIFAMTDQSRSGHGSGGMHSKLKAAQFALEAGVHVVIAPGKSPGILSRIMRGEDCGTFLPSPGGGKLTAFERWVGYGRSSRGRRISVDTGAVEALINKKRSLLPAGVVAVEGTFSPGDVVEIAGPDGELVARGLVNYSSADLDRIKGRKTAEIESILGYRGYDEAAHRDNLVMVGKNPAQA